MSIVALKRKSVAQYGSHISGKSPGGSWIPRGPGLIPVNTNNNGFSINGSYRNKGRVGTSSAFSSSKTLFRGQYAVGWGGRGNTYYDVPLFNVNNAVIVPGTQYKYVKPSVLTTHGLLSTKYKWMSGQFPNYWVGHSNQDMYISKKSEICKASKYETASQYIQRNRCIKQTFQNSVPRFTKVVCNSV